MNSTKELPKRLYRARKALGMTQAHLGSLVYACGGTISDWERGRSIPGADSVILLCRALGVSADWLLGLTDQKEKRPECGNTQRRR